MYIYFTISLFAICYARIFLLCCDYEVKTAWVQVRRVLVCLIYGFYLPFVLIPLLEIEPFTYIFFLLSKTSMIIYLCRSSGSLGVSWHLLCCLQSVLPFYVVWIYIYLVYIYICFYVLGLYIHLVIIVYFICVCSLCNIDWYFLLFPTMCFRQCMSTVWGKVFWFPYLKQNPLPTLLFFFCLSNPSMIIHLCRSSGPLSVSWPLLCCLQSVLPVYVVWKQTEAFCYSPLFALGTIGCYIDLR